MAKRQTRVATPRPTRSRTAAAPRPPRTTCATRRAEQQAAFLAAYARIATVKDAAQAAGVGRRTHYDWLAADATYVERFEEARRDATDVLLREARRRAVVGVQEPVFYRGEAVGTVTKYSDVLLIFLLKGLLPQVFRDRVEHTGAHGEGIRVASTALDLTTLSTEDLETLEPLLARATSPRAGRGADDAR